MNAQIREMLHMCEHEQQCNTSIWLIDRLVEPAFQTLSTRSQIFEIPSSLPSSSRKSEKKFLWLAFQNRFITAKIFPSKDRRK